MRIWGVFLSLGLGFLAQPAVAQNAWVRFTTPAPGNPESIGFYSNGCLRGSIDLPLDGAGYQSIYTTANHHFGHNQLIEFVSEFAKNIDGLGSGLLIGELSQVRGGPFASGHASHQVGLDVDILFYTHPEQRIRSLSVEERDHINAQSMLNGNGLVDPSRFGPDQILKLKLASLDPKTERIFVNPAIKLYLCNNLDTEELFWLRKLRPWRGHHAHFHVRIQCPLDSKECVSQDPPPEGDGCQELFQGSKKKVRLPKMPALDSDFSALIEDEGDDHSAEELMDPELSSILESPKHRIDPLPASCLKVMEE
jgi:penicillin-insensitive murein endopeptidase